MSLNNPLLDFSNHPLFDEIKPEHIAPALDQLLPAADAALETVTAADFPAEWKAIAAVLDVATEMRLEKHKEDFGQTLGYWGVPNGPYLVLPLLGPSTLRDGASLPVDFAVSPTQYINDIPTRNQVFALRLVSKRAELLKSGNMLEEASIDKYSFTRDAYLQYRRSQIYDGNPPDEEDSNDDPSANPAANPAPAK